MKHSNNVSASKQKSKEQPPDVYKLVGANDNPAVESLLFKLTDEFSLSLRNAISAKSKIRVNVQEKSIILEIINNKGEHSTFSCVSQSLNAPIDAVCFDRKKTFRTISSINTKFQVEATAKSFTDVREKHLKLIDEEEKRKTKELPDKFGNNKSKNTSERSVHHRTFPSSKPKIPTHVNKAAVPAPFVKRYAPPPPPQPATNHHHQKVNGDVQEKPLTHKKVNGDVQEKPPADQKVNGDVQEKPPAAKKPRFDHHHQSSNSTTVENANNGNGGGDGDALLLDMTPSRDWSNHFGKIRSEKEAAEYRNIFDSDYPVYKQCFELQNKISDELCKLKMDFDASVEGSPSYNEIASVIMAKAEKLRHDPDFLSQRQRHVDLNAKLRVLKARFSEWENATGAEQQPRKVIKQEKGLSVPNRPVPTYDSNFDL